jgi:polar amino acid transport system substrate-binding protein
MMAQSSIFRTTMKKISILILVLCTLLSCSKSSNGGRRVGVDPYWSPLDLGTRENSVTACSTDLLTEIGKLEKIPFVKVSVNGNDFMEGLQKGQYEAILSSMRPYIFNRELFDFSDIYLALGPVLVVPAKSNIDSLKNLEGKEIAVITGSTYDQILQKSNGVLIRYYDSIPKALNDILLGVLDGAMIDIFSATPFCRDLYEGELKIATPPLNDDGLRMVVKHNTASDLIKGFNTGLAQMKKDGSYEKLIGKWGF